MDEVQLSMFRERLEQLRAELLEQREQARAATRPVVLDQSSVGRLSRMDAMQGQAMAIESQRRRAIHLNRIDLALRRVKAGEFGVCRYCDEDIDPQRLEVDPTAVLCIACASRTD